MGFQKCKDALYWAFLLAILERPTPWALGCCGRAGGPFCINKKHGRKDRKLLSLNAKRSSWPAGARRDALLHQQPGSSWGRISASSATVLMPGPGLPYWRPSCHRDVQVAGPMVQMSNRAQSSTPSRHVYN